MLTQVGVKQLTDFLRTVTAASDLVDCTLVHCVTGETPKMTIPHQGLAEEYTVYFGNKRTEKKT